MDKDEKFYKSLVGENVYYLLDTARPNEYIIGKGCLLEYIKSSKVSETFSGFTVEKEVFIVENYSKKFELDKDRIFSDLSELYEYLKNKI